MVHVLMPNKATTATTLMGILTHMIAKNQATKCRPLLSADSRRMDMFSSPLQFANSSLLNRIYA
jgi:hypothetical protein